MERKYCRVPEPPFDWEFIEGNDTGIRTALRAFEIQQLILNIDWNNDDVRRKDTTLLVRIYTDKKCQIDVLRDANKRNHVIISCAQPNNQITLSFSPQSFAFNFWTNDSMPLVDWYIFIHTLKTFARTDYIYCALKTEKTAFLHKRRKYNKRRMPCEKSLRNIIGICK